MTHVKSEEMFKTILFFFLVVSNIFFASGAVKIDGITSNVSEGTIVQLIQYRYGDVEIAKTFVSSNTFKFVIPDSFNDGVFTIVLSDQYAGLKTNTCQYDIILDKSERYIKLRIDPTNGATLDIIDSKINKNYYDYLKLENFRIATIEYLLNQINSNKKPTISPTKSFKEIAENEIKELKEIRQNYINSNFNKWSTELAKNSTSILLYEKVNKDSYWSFFSTNNPDLINSPIYHKLIQQYLLSFFKLSTESAYQFAFEEVISQFNGNSETKEWIVRYIIVELNQLGNRNLIDFFSNKYNYKS